MAWSKILRATLLRIAKKVLEGVVSKLMVQNKLVDSLADQLSKYLTDLLVVWEGDDAREFVDQVRRELVPELGRLSKGILGLGTNINVAQERIIKSDTDNTRIVQSIRDGFSKVQW